MSFSPRSRPATPLLVCSIFLALILQATANAASGPALTVAAAGDISCPADLTDQSAGEFEDPEVPMADMRCQGQRVSELIAAGNPNFVLALGDLIQSQQPTTHAYNDFQATWEPLRGKVMPTIGNHDYLRERGSIAPSGYFDYWLQMGTPRWRSGTPTESWSSWNTGQWHMINLNSNCDRVDCSFSGPQLRWLLRDLKANRADPSTQCTLAYMHHPRFSAGIEAGRTGDKTLLVNAWELLYRYRADVIVTGHQHFYQRFARLDPDGNRDKSGIRQFITGTGGASTFPLENEDGDPAEQAVASERALGATFFSLSPTGYSWEFRNIEGGTFDSGRAEVPCHDPNEGAELRAPRNALYAAHMARMRHLNTRVRKLKSRIRKLTVRHAKSQRVRPFKQTLRKVTRVREDYRVKRLY